MISRKQKRKGKKATNRAADLEAMSQEEFTVFRTSEPRLYCPNREGCGAEITTADFDAGKCTQCGRELD